MRKILFICSLCLGLAVLAVHAETYTLTGGGSVAGDILKFDDSGIMFHMPTDTYTNVPWGRFSQDALKKLARNPKIAPFVEPFIEPTAPAHLQKTKIKVQPVSRLQLPEHPSLFLGLLTSSLGFVILLVLYAANLLAAYEISIVKARPAAQVIGLAAVLPVVAPIIFLSLPIKMEPLPEETETTPADGATPPAGSTEQKPSEEVQIAEASWKPQVEEKKPEAQVYSRGKFTFNKRFIETRFEAFAGATPGDLAKKYDMEVKTMKDQFAVERIMQITQMEIIFETVQRGQVTVPFADIQEIKLNPKTA